MTQRQELSRPEVETWLDSWVGESVAIRVTASGVLHAVFHGLLRERSGEKTPATFWPLVHAEQADNADHLERAGIYLHESSFQDAILHAGSRVVELRQGGVTLNLRRL